MTNNHFYYRRAEQCCCNEAGPGGMVPWFGCLQRAGVMFQLHWLPVSPAADQVWTNQEDEWTGMKYRAVALHVYFNHHYGGYSVLWTIGNRLGFVVDNHPTLRWKLRRPFLGFAQAFSVLFVQKKKPARIDSYTKAQLRTCTVDYTTAYVGESTICLHSLLSSFSLPLMPLTW